MRLQDYLKMKGTSVRAFAKLSGISQPTMNRYVQGKRFPSPANLHQISQATDGKVTFEDWAHAYQPKEKRHD